MVSVSLCFWFGFIYLLLYYFSCLPSACLSILLFAVKLRSSLTGKESYLHRERIFDLFLMLYNQRILKQMCYKKVINFCCFFVSNIALLNFLLKR